MGTCPNCGLWEGVHASGEYCRCNEDGWHNAQPITQPEPDVPAEAHAAQCAAYQTRIAELESTIDKLTHRPSVMNARDTAINICGCLEVRVEPAGAIGAFWFIAGPRRTGRNVAEMDAATIRTSIAQALLARDDKIAALEAQVKALTEERDQARREHADAQHRYTVAMHDISKACAGTTARSACEVVELWRKERNAQAEAVRDIVAAIKNEPELPGLMPDEMWAMLNGNRDLTQLALVRAVQATKEGIIKNAKNNAIARAAVEGGSK